jgi:hypothetical protein
MIVILSAADALSAAASAQAPSTLLKMRRMLSPCRFVVASEWKSPHERNAHSLSIGFHAGLCE